MNLSGFKMSIFSLYISPGNAAVLLIIMAEAGDALTITSLINGLQLFPFWLVCLIRTQQRPPGAAAGGGERSLSLHLQHC